MAEFEHLLTTQSGVAWHWREDEGTGATLAAVQDVAPILEANKAMNTENNGYSQSKELRRAASIPLSIIYKWMTEEGWDPFSQDPDCQKKLAQKLDSDEYRYLRTAHFIIGDHWRHSI